MNKNHLNQVLNRLKNMVTSRVTWCIAISGAITLITLNLNFFRVEAFLYDARMRLHGEQADDSNLSLVYIDDSVDNSGTPLWASMSAQVQALETIVAQKPRAIVFLNRLDLTDVNTNSKLADKFVNIAKEAGQNGIQVLLGTDIDLGGEIIPPYPLSLLPHGPAVLHKDGSIFGEDKVVRRGLLTAFDEPTLHMRVAFPGLSDTELLQKAKAVRGAYFFRPAESWHVLIKYPSATELKEANFPKKSLPAVLNGEIASDYFKQKIVLIDTVRKDAINDYVTTPYSKITYSNPRLIVHAAIIDTLMGDRGIRIVTKRIDILITLLLALILTTVTISMSPTRGVATVLILSGSLFAISLLLFKFGFWIRLVHPLFAMFCTYYIIVPYRAIIEYKKRWEVQEKHDILVQVEELKGNFLSLMSHDLKTPVARIQGLAELVLRQGGLSSLQTEEIKQIIHSTDNLDKFISKILNLTKVESNEIKLNKRSRDINSLIEQCVDKLSFQAKVKNINLEANLEPIFPIQVDSALIIQVFTNLIDNAIKYSPENSTIRISSKDLGEHVEVRISDSGPGMDSSETEQLFKKFFRGRAQFQEQTKGSGLGLYLSKYFINLHQGSIFVNSAPGKGSEFRIELPVGKIDEGRVEELR